MLEKPDIQDKKIIACLQENYALEIAKIDFLPLGADSNTAVYRVTTHNDTPYFLKLRSGDFDEASVTYPKLLSDYGLKQVIAPLSTKAGRLWANFDDMKVMLFPFIEGKNGYEVKMSKRHWYELGTTFKQMHNLPVPSSITKHIKQETYSSHWRDIVTSTLAQMPDTVFDDPGAAKLAAALHTKRNEIRDLVCQADRLAQTLQRQPADFIVCHADIHAGNVFIATDDAFYIVDWDTLILAPKERDLMYIGGSLMGGWYTPAEEEALFYQGYGKTKLDPTPLAYYRYERIIEDIAEYCGQLFSPNMGGEDLAQFVHYFESNFRPNGTIATAYKSDQTRNGKQKVF